MFKCSVCSREISKKSHLKRHMIRWHSGRPVEVNEQKKINDTIDEQTEYTQIKSNMNASENEVEINGYEAFECVCGDDSDDAMGNTMPCSNDSCLNVASKYECGTKCSRMCQNQHFRKGRIYSIAVRMTESKGKGVFANEVIPAGHFVIEYLGEIIDKAEYHKRISSDNQNFFFMAMSAELYLDARKFGNEARYINHSCNTNGFLQCQNHFACKSSFWSSFELRAHCLPSPIIQPFLIHSFTGGRNLF